MFSFISIFNLKQFAQISSDYTDVQRQAPCCPEIMAGSALTYPQYPLEKLQQDTARRLLVLGDIESALQTLLIRTEPPEKKPFWFIRLLRRAGLFCRKKLPRLLTVKWPRRKG